MPELPEVETTLRGIKPAIIRKKVTDVVIRHPTLRFPIPKELKDEMLGEILHSIKRRGKYLLLSFDSGTLILHLGMSGRLRVLQGVLPAQKHDHVDIYFGDTYLRFTDPRRFGAILWTKDSPDEHPLLKHLGPEPLTAAFNGDYLWEHAARRKVSVKNFIMDNKIVVGVGNIYATEALFLAHIRPQKAAGKVTHHQYQTLAATIKAVLIKAIEKGGTTLKDFRKSDGKPGYFKNELQVYGLGGKSCPRCQTTLKSLKIGQRSTVYCPACQK